MFKLQLNGVWYSVRIKIKKDKKNPRFYRRVRISILELTGEEQKNDPDGRQYVKKVYKNVASGSTSVHANDRTKEKFDKFLGYRKALTRALQRGGFIRDDRKLFWQKYYEQVQRKPANAR